MMRWMLVVFLGIQIASPARGEERPATKEKGKQAAVEAALGDLAARCYKGDLSEAAKRVVYRGKTTARKWKDVCDASTPEEALQVKGVCDRVKATLGTGKIKILSYQTETESEGTWHALEVRDTKGGKAYFAFLEIQGSFALGDID